MEGHDAGSLISRERGTSLGHPHPFTCRASSSAASRWPGGVSKVQKDCHNIQAQGEAELQAEDLLSSGGGELQREQNSPVVTSEHADHMQMHRSER